MSLTIADMLNGDIQNTPDPIHVKGAHTKGRRTKLGIMAFWHALFELNELNPSSKKMTNAEIARQMNLEFPGRPAIEKLLEKPSEVNTFRHMYNTGTLIATRKEKPKHISFRYNAKGNKVDPRTERVLTASEVQATIERFTNWETKPRGPSKPRTVKKKKTKTKE
jgi:hypothetical protein